ncbi:MAG: hypothetical protein CL484_07055 [Acidobacteria bacterium]|nr:hypothetical protein [Acidobacteriota bacterium]HCV00494.1 hypothetical protein [Dehalococcoidia bacterium]|tara:strand:- start:950 stop:1393 length:444 start_codon:yes stop_codon:yes gene_type:complete
MAGVLLTVHVVPVLNGRVVAFLLNAEKGPSGQWLPWTVLKHGSNPYEIASALVDEWCEGPMSDLRLVDVLSKQSEDGWELSIVFRAELTSLPGDARGSPQACEPQNLADIHGFQAVDLKRWLEMASPSPKLQEAPTQASGDDPSLVF